MDEKTNRSQSHGGQDRPEIDLAKPHEHHMVPVWFFVGVILLIYGIIIFCHGNLRVLQSAARRVLANTHPAVWWGALLTVIGGIYVTLTSPRNPEVGRSEGLMGLAAGMINRCPLGIR